MDEELRLAIIRQAFAQRLSFVMGIDDPRIETAFAAVRREDFLGPGPWQTMLWPRAASDTYVATPSADPAWLYMDCIFAILPERHLNNGAPSLHAKLMAEAPINEGDHVVHVGPGSGYYTAVMAHLAGPSGRVTAIEFDPALAQRARQNLASLPQVSVRQGDGCTAPFDAADVIYVNAGVTRPADAWLDRLKDGGRLILPLTGTRGFRNAPPLPIDQRGGVFRIERQPDGYLARWISAVAIIPCEGGREPAGEAALDGALQKGGAQNVTRLYRNEDIPGHRCWLKAPGWTLAYS